MRLFWNQRGDGGAAPSPACVRLVAITVLVALIAISGCGGADPTDPGVNSDRVLVIIVPGTWGNETFWPNDVDDKVTFGSELARGLGGEHNVYPFLWVSSVFHEGRMEAVDLLVEQIDARAEAFDRVCLVGHSHGGNVALLAASKCRSDIDRIVCLSTPHVHLRTKSSPGAQDELLLPVYCPPATLKKVASVVCIYPETDLVVPLWANALQGLDESEANRMTIQWQEQEDHPRLAKDDVLTRARDRLNEIMPVPLFGSGNLVARAELAAPSSGEPSPVVNLRMHSLVDDALGLKAHNTVHSRRIGFLVGQYLRDGDTDSWCDSMRRYVQPAEADDGQPISEKEHRVWLDKNEPSFEHAGWKLERFQLELTQGAIAEAADPTFFRLPDPLLRLQVLDPQGDEVESHTDTKSDVLKADWRPRFLVPEGRQFVLEVLDEDDVGFRFDSLGKIKLIADGCPDTSVASDPSQGRHWSATMTWSSYHH